MDPAGLSDHAHLNRESWNADSDQYQTDHGPHALPYEGFVDFMLPHWEWIALFRAHGFEIEDLLELRPPADAASSYRDAADREWSRRWPAEQIWRVRRR